MPCPDGCATCVNQFQCTACLTTYTLNHPTSWQCSCLDDQYTDSNDECVQCPSNCASCTDGDTCTSCETSYTLDDDDACNCSDDTFLYNGVCTAYDSCVLGQYNNNVDNTCLDCPAVDYCAECGWVDSAIKCTRCDENFTLD